MKLLKKMTAVLLCVGLLTALWGCQEQAEPTEPSVTLAPVQMPDLQLTKGQTLTLTPQSTDGQWSSSDPERAAVDENGVVTALSDRGSVTVSKGDESWEIALCQETPYGNVPLSSSNEKLTIGVWNGSYHAFDDFRLEMMRMAGISLIIGVEEQWVGNSGMQGLLDRAQEYGVSIMADLRNWDGVTVPDYAEHPMLAGFLMYDEPCATQFEDLAQMKQQFDAVMPADKTFFVNIFPEACSYESLFGDPYDPSCVDYETYYSNLFVDTVQPEMLAVDTYPLQEGGYIRSTYYHGMDVLSHKAKQTGIPYWHTLLSSGHYTTDGRYVTPTQRELRWQMAMAMSYGAEALIHYILTTNEEGYDPILEYESWYPTEVYDAVSAVNNEFLSWQDIYMSYDWMGIAKVDAGSENTMLAGLEYDIPFTQTGALIGAESDQDLLIGCFEGEYGNGYMVTNAGDTSECDLWLRLNFTIEDAAVKLQLAEGNYLCAAVIKNGQISYVPVNADNTVELTVEAFNGAFVIPVIQ